MRFSLSFRTRILLVVLAVAVIPLGLLGLWLTGTAQRSGETLLRDRLAEAIDQTVTQIVSRWIGQRSQLLYLAEDDAVQRALSLDPPDRVAQVDPTGVRDPPPSLVDRFDGLDAGVEAITIRDVLGRDRWVLQRSPGTSAAGFGGAGSTLDLELAIYERATGQHLGTLITAFEPEALLPPASVAPAAAGMIMGLFGATTGISHLPLPFDPFLLAEDRFSWGGVEWVTARRTLEEPPLTLVAAAPLSGFTAPFERAARRGTWLLLLVAVTGLALAAILTSRMTRSLRRLSAAAEAVSDGDLDRRVEPVGDDEVGRVARAFNSMTENLQTSLGELANRESLAAVGEFAATLAHEVRNPLTAVRVDLQFAEEGLEDSARIEAQRRALAEIARLDETVSRVLKVARSGRIRATRVDLRGPLRAAAAAARPAFAQRAATLSLAPLPDPIAVTGDAGALEQLFLNLMRNAAEALDSGGEATVSVERVDGEVLVTVRDTGPGIPDEVRERVFEPLFSTRPEGTGLGLPIARRIAIAHGGEIDLESSVGVGTTARVRLRLADRQGAALARSDPAGM
jgi:signal transduction histidine kinase